MLGEYGACRTTGMLYLAVEMALHQWLQTQYSGASGYEHIFRAKNSSGYGVSGYEHNLATAASGKPRVSARESVPSEVWLSAR
jgi:hypothetical protein